MQSWTLPELNYPPLRDKLDVFMRELHRSRGEEVDFVVLFGSAARGQARAHSDLDLLVGLKRDGAERFLDRLGSFSDLGPSVEAFPYYPSELELMTRQLHMTLLEAVDHGLVLADEGGWGAIQARLQPLITQGRIEKIPHGWRLLDRSVLSGPVPTSGL